jgi:hypothetical protein
VLNNQTSKQFRRVVIQDEMIDYFKLFKVMQLAKEKKINKKKNSLQDAKDLISKRENKKIPFYYIKN